MYIHSTGGTDTIGTLFGPDGSQLATDDNSGQGNNFRLAVSVTPGLYLLEVRGKDEKTRGAYELVTNFVTGDEVEGPTTTTPTTPTTPTTTAPDADPTGNLDEPPNNGTRSGIGLIRGWVCQDAGEGVEIRITGPSGSNSRTRTITALYGSERDDVEDANSCDRRGNDFGFAVQYNYNLLPAGTYEIEAFVGREQIGLSNNGQTNTFTVARISNSEFLNRTPNNSRVLVENFPARGVTTILEFDLSSQNFEIQGTQ